MHVMFGSDGYYDTEVGNISGVILLCSGFLGEGSLGGRLLGGRPLGGGLLGGRCLADIFLDHNLQWLFTAAR